MNCRFKASSRGQFGLVRRIIVKCFSLGGVAVVLAACTPVSRSAQSVSSTILVDSKECDRTHAKCVEGNDNNKTARLPRRLGPDDPRVNPCLDDEFWLWGPCVTEARRGWVLRSSMKAETNLGRRMSAQLRTLFLEQLKEVNVFEKAYHDSWAATQVPGLSAKELEARLAEVERTSEIYSERRQYYEGLLEATESELQSQLFEKIVEVLPDVAKKKDVLAVFDEAEVVWVQPMSAGRERQIFTWPEVDLNPMVAAEIDLRFPSD